MNRLDLIKRIKASGWKHSLLFGGDGPYLQITGLINHSKFNFIGRVPVSLEDDHVAFWDQLCKDLFIERLDTTAPQ